ncbi:MAG TPA: DUF397 domain-containing protein [Micromonosporaceae bacterium]
MTHSTVHGGVSPVDLSRVQWRISSRSSDTAGGTCVEAGPLNDGTGRVALRHSQYPDGPVIIYTRAEWNAFLAGAKDNEFDFTA